MMRVLWRFNSQLIGVNEKWIFTISPPSILLCFNCWLLMCLGYDEELTATSKNSMWKSDQILVNKSIFDTLIDRHPSFKLSSTNTYKAVRIREGEMGTTMGY